MDLAFLAEMLPRLLPGIPLTLALAAISLAAGFTLAILLALLRLASRMGELLVRGYVFVLRGTPLLVLIFLLYYGLGQFAGVRHSPLWPFLRQPFWCAILALTLNSAAYGAEIVRGGLASVPIGVIDAGRALSLSRARLFWLLVMPIALRQALPACGNEMIIIVKATSLASIITLMEITGIARALSAETFRPFEVFGCAGALYLAINFLLARGIALLEYRLSPHLRPAPA